MRCLLGAPPGTKQCRSATLKCVACTVLRKQTWSPNLPPSPRSLDTGRGASRSGTPEAGNTVCCAGLCRLQAKMGQGGWQMPGMCGRLQPLATASMQRAAPRQQRLYTASVGQSTYQPPSPAAQLGHQLCVRYARAAGIPQLLSHCLPQLRNRGRCTGQQPLARLPLMGRTLPPGWRVRSAAHVYLICLSGRLICNRGVRPGQPSVR